MFSKSFTASLFLLALTSSVTADTGSCVSPALGVSGTPGASDVQHPSDNAPCGNIPIAQNIGTSTPLSADSNGLFKPTITNFAR